MKWKQFLIWGLVAACVNDYDIKNKKNGVTPALDTVVYDTSVPIPLTDSVPYMIDTGDDPELIPPTWPEMLVTPDSYDFGELKINCSDEYEATIASVGTEPLIIENWTYSSTADLSMETDIELPLTLDPGEEAIVKFVYEEKDLFTDWGRLYIDSNDLMDPNQMISHEGIGVPTGTQYDNFSQGGISKADILFVIDNSCSMGDEQAALGLNSVLFIQSLLDSDVDFQIAVITTDNAATRSGIMTNGTSGIEDILEEAIVAGIYGSPWEEGQEYAKLALEPGGTLEASGPFQREDAFLSVIIVSDEEDSSPLDDAEYYDFFSTLKEDKMFALHTVVSTIEDLDMGVGGAPGGGGGGGRSMTHTGHTGDTGYIGHTGDTGAPVMPVRQCGIYGGRYIDQSKALSGTTLNICEGTWGDFVAILAKDSFNPNLIFPLSRIPLDGVIAIKTNGTLITSGWTYDDVSNVVNFTPDMAPGEGVLVQIIYDYVEECDE